MFRRWFWEFILDFFKGLLWIFIEDYDRIPSAILNKNSPSVYTKFSPDILLDTLPEILSWILKEVFKTFLQMPLQRFLQKFLWKKKSSEFLSKNAPIISPRNTHFIFQKLFGNYTFCLTIARKMCYWEVHWRTSLIVSAKSSSRISLEITSWISYSSKNSLEESFFPVMEGLPS